MLIPNKHNGYSGGVRRLCMPDMDDGGGGGGAAAPMDTVYQHQIPRFAPEIAPYAQTLLGQAAALTDTKMNPYMQYQGERLAQFSPLQNQSYENMALMRSQPQLQDATALAGQAGLGALNTQYTFDPSNFNKAFSAANIKDAKGNVTGNTMMNPYMDNVVARQQQDAQRQADIARQSQQAQAARSGAFGGSGDYLMRGQAAGNLARQKGDIQAQGLNTAYNQAMQQYNTQNQQNAQQQQYGAGLGLQGLQMANQSAQNLGTLGGLQYQQNMGINQMQNQYGLQQQGQVQQDLTNKYQDFLNQQNYPYKQMGFMSDMIRGLPLAQQSTQSMYPQAAPPSMLGQVAGLGMGAYGLSQMGAKFAEGGEVKTYAGDRGSVTSQDNKEALIDDTYSIKALMQAKQAALARRDVDTANAIDERIAQLNAIQAQSASINRGLGSAFNQIPEEQQETMMAANGGIVAFADRGLVPQTSEDLGVEAALQQAGKSKSPFELIQDWTGDTARKNDPNSEYNRVMRESGRAPAPTMTNRPQPKGAGARSTPSFIAKDAPVERPAPKQKKLSPAINKAVTEMAEKQGVPKDEFMDAFNQMRDKLQAESKEDLKGLQDLIDKQSGKSKQIKDQALGKALAEFGFNMAAQASKTGRGKGFAGLLGSAAAASPTLAASAAESQKLAAAADENDMKLQMEMRKFNIATRKNDSATAMQHATNMRQLQQSQETIRLQQAQLAEQHRANRAREGLQGQQIAARSGTSGLRAMQYVAKSKTEAAKMAIKDVEGKIKAGMTVVKPEDYDRMVNQAMKKYLPMTTGFGMTGISSSKDDDDIIDLD
tara:strand:- start:12944 stop:15412 length:2469 start_codon:yes stop_codon:yes gene_type:complete